MLGTVSKIVLYIMVSVVYGIIYAILMRLPKKLRAIIMTIVLIITVIAVGAYAYSQASPQEIAQSKIFAAQQLKHFKYCDDYLQCLEKGGFGKSELVYEIKNDDFDTAIFLSEDGFTYRVDFEKKEKDGLTQYRISDIDIDKEESRHYSDYCKPINEDVEYIWTSVNSYVAKFDFEGYKPEIININMTVAGLDMIFHYYIIDKSKEPVFNCNYAPVYGLLNEAEAAERAVEICDIIMNMDLDTDVNTLADKIGASDVKKLPASIPDTYDYTLDSDFTFRSHGLPYESFVMSTKYGSVTFNMSDKTIKANY